MNKKIELSILAVIGISIITLLGVAFSYFVAIGSTGGDNITGRTMNFGAGLSISTVYRATNLVPLSNNLVSTAITKENNKCIDINNRDVCSLYTITLSNSGDTVELIPYVTTTSTTYTTTNLKCQLYNSSYTAVSDVITLSTTANGKVYLTSNSNNVTINLGSSSQTYYLVIWLADTTLSQTSDYSKTYSGTITFEAGNGGTVYASFNS